MEEKKLHEYIKDKDNLDEKELSELVNKAPYSQAVRRLQNSGNSDFALMRYDWSPKAEPESLRFDDIVSLSEVDMSEKKSRKKPPRPVSLTQSEQSSKEPEQTPADIKGQEKSGTTAEAVEMEKRSTASTVNKTADISSKPKSKIESGELDDFTLWLNSLGATEKNTLPESGKSDTPKSKKKAKSKKKKSGKSKKKKDEIKEKIEESVTDKDEIVSRSLAELYEKQGYFGKAIEMYEKLSLKFPQKSAFFADQIQKLKEKI